MTLGQFSVAVGSPPRWVQNAFSVLGLRSRYTVKTARQLALAHLLQETTGMPLVKGYPVAGRALANWPRTASWQRSSPDAAVTLAVDLERFLSTFTVRLSLAHTLYAPRRRGRERLDRSSGVARARDYGVDIGLLESSLRRTPEERLRRLDANVSFVRRMRVRPG